jgi:phage-related protein
MADTEEFLYERQAGASGTVKFNMAKTQYGDGYTQKFGWGLNPMQQTWPLTFEGMEADLQEVYDFLVRHAGARPFLWKPPFASVASLFRAEEFNPISVGGGLMQITVTFIQDFNP